MITGGTGDDRFDFNRFDLSEADTRVDAIVDFEVGRDKIGLFNFQVTSASLQAGAFQTGTAATEADDRIIYDPATGALFFDPDGVGGASAVQFASLSTGLSLAPTDFIA